MDNGVRKIMACPQFRGRARPRSSPILPASSPGGFQDFRLSGLGNSAEDVSGPQIVVAPGDLGHAKIADQIPLPIHDRKTTDLLVEHQLFDVSELVLLR